MKAFTEPLLSLAGFEEMTKTAEKSSGLISVTGCIDAQKSQMIYAFGGHRKNKLIVTFGEQKAKELYDEYSFFDKEVVYYPSKDVLFYQSDIRGNLLTAERIRALKAIREKECVTLVTTFDALMNTMAPIEKMWENVLTLEQGQLLDLKGIQAALIRMGYEKEYQVQTMGQFSVRGGILDVFPLTEENPIRIELWGDEIDTIRFFDCESQKSIENTDSVSIYPAAELVLSDEEKAGGIEKLKAEAKRVSDKLRKQMKTEEAHRVSVMADELTEEWGELSMYAGMDAFLSYFFDERVGLLDYFNPSDSLIFFDELTRCTEQGKLTETEFSESMKQRLAMGYILPGQMNGLFTEKEIVAKLEKYSCIALGALDNKANGLHQLSLKLASVGIVLVSAFLTMQGTMPLYIFLMMAVFSFTIFARVELVQNGAHTMELMETAMDKLERIENAKYIDEDAKPMQIRSCDIDFDKVTFGYDKRKILDGVSFHIPQGSTTAVVGPSGSGKTTICNLLARFYDVDGGSIRIGGTDIRKMTCDSLLANISMVFQNVYLFHDTILNNIRFGKPDATREEVVAAAKKACCHEFIEKLPQGYDTVVGEGGSSLSGGEKQRISIARAILKDAPIVILDEATASVDPENEHLIQSAISELTRGKTMITIAHRLATIENANQILVVDDGKIAQKGTHRELAMQEGRYQNFVKIRERTEGWQIQ